MLSDFDLEEVCAGKADVKATLAKANNAFDAHAATMRALGEKGSQLLDNGNKLLAG